MSSNKPEHLFKYLTPNGCLEALQTLTLRWSSPACFPDPFEMDLSTPIPFEVKTLLDSTIKLASSMIFAPEQPKGDSPLLNAIRRWREEGRFASPEEAQPVLRDLLSKMVDHRKDQLESALMQWMEFTRNRRICCFCAKPDIAGAWDKFADYHQGVALRFDTTEAPFTGPRAVIYQTHSPQLTSIREQLGAILHNRKDAMIDRFGDHNLIKPSEYKTEHEWRCFKEAQQRINADNQDSASWFDQVGFNETSLTGIFFGLACGEDTRKKVIEVAQTRAPHAKFFSAQLSASQFTIEFERLAK